MTRYVDVPPERWHGVTEELIADHPLKVAYLAGVVVGAWDMILETKIAGRFAIARDVKPKPQIMGFFLHEVIAFLVATDYPTEWRKEVGSADKDLVYIPDPRYSIEIKTSSNNTSIFGNRSYAQATQSEKKDKSGYYLAVNFDKFNDSDKTPKIRLVRFGWIDHGDWIGQAAASGQQARLPRNVETGKLLTIYNS